MPRLPLRVDGEPPAVNHLLPHYPGHRELAVEAEKVVDRDAALGRLPRPRDPGPPPEPEVNPAPQDVNPA